jgi:hypothetical protein
MAEYSCDAVRDALFRLSGQYGNKIYGKGFTYGPWVAGTPRGTWEDGLGITLNNLIWERTLPTDAGDEWVDANPSNFSTIDNCNVTPETLHWGQTSRAFRVQKRHLQTEEICFEDLRTSFQYEAFMGKLQQSLNAVGDFVWDSRDRDEYIRLSDHKVTETDVLDLDATSFTAANPPTRRLTWGTLESIYDYLDGEGVLDAGGAVGMSNKSGRPIIDLYSDANTIRDLIRQDPELREDFRFAYEGSGINSPLLQMRGSAMTYNGYRTVQDNKVKRYDIVGGQIVYRPKYLPAVQNATVGWTQAQNPQWRYAKYQISVVHIPAVYMQRVQATKGPIAGMPFNPVSFMGDFEFLVIRDKVCNPKGNKGFFDAYFGSASEPGLTHLGFAIAHLNCPPYRAALTSCS